MQRAALHALMLSRKMSQSELARLAGVSRQAVSLWARIPDHAPVGMRAVHFVNLSRATGLGLDELAASWPVLGTPLESELVTELLWDRLYPGLLEFARGLLDGEDKALARLAQVHGLYRSARIAGAQAWGRFPRYRRHIQPQRREGLDLIWRFETSLA